eukprot:3604876-Rhodomonas_salina.1
MLKALNNPPPFFRYLSLSSSPTSRLRPTARPCPTRPPSLNFAGTVKHFARPPKSATAEARSFVRGREGRR